MQSAAFTDAFEQVTTITPEQSDSQPIVKISGIDRDREGNLLISDNAEGRVSLFASDGRLLRTIAKKGNGPGEMQYPFDPRFASDGTIHVPDLLTGRISVFSQDGSFLRHAVPEGVQIMMDFLILPNGNYLIAGRPVAGNDTSILFEVAPTGRLVRRSLAIGALTPPGERRSAAWEPVRRFSVAASEQAYFGTNTLVDSLWSFDPRSGRVSAAAMPVPGYVPARLPRRTRTNADLYAWTQSFFNVSSVHTTGGFVLIPFVRGTLIDGDPVIYALRRENGSWMALSGGPPVLRAVDGLVIALENPLEDPVRLSVFRRKS